MTRKLYALYCLVMFCMISVGEMKAQKHLQILQSNPDIKISQLDSIMEDWVRAPDNPNAKRDAKHYERWRIHQMGYYDTQEHLINSASQIWSEYKRLEKTKDKTEHDRTSNGTWEDYTPGEFGGIDNLQGRLNTMAIHPTNDQIIYVGSAFGGLWKTTDGGQSWNQLTDGLPVSGVSGIAIDHTDPDILYVLTGDGDGGNIPSMGIIKSTDAGLTWDITGLTFGLGELIYGYKLIMHPTNPDIMFAVTNNGIYRTLNGWNSFNISFAGFRFYDIERKPNSGGVYYAATARQVMRTSNTGNDWILWSDSTNLPDAPPTHRIDIAMTPQYPNRVYALYAQNVDGNGYSGLFISSDNGQSWVMKTDTGMNIVGKDDYNQVAYDLAMTIDPTDTNTIFVAGINIFKSTTGGEEGSWNYSSHTVHSDVHDLVWRNGTLYACTDGGLSKTTNGGSSWTNLSSGLKIRQFYFLDVDAARIIAGAQDNGTTMWNKGDPVGVQVGGDDGLLPLFHPDPLIVFLSTQDTRKRALNGGGNSSSYSHILPVDMRGDLWTAPMIIHPSDPDIIYSGIRDGQLIRSYQLGDSSSWAIVDTGYEARIVTLGQSPNNPDVMYASDRHEVRRTDNIHTTPVVWDTITSNLPMPDTNTSLLLVEIVVDPENENRLWCALTGFVEGEKVYKSENGGQTWTNISEGLPNVGIRSLVYQDGSNDGLYVGTALGVYYRNASMTEWKYFGNGMPNTRVYDLKIQGGYLYAALFGNGVWRSPLIAACPNNLTITNANLPYDPYNIGIRAHEAEISITSTLSSIVPSLGTDIRFSAGGSVLFTEGFEMRSGIEFLAEIGGCEQ